MTQKPDISPYDPASAAFRNRIAYEAFKFPTFTSAPTADQTLLAYVIDERFNFVYQRATRLLYGSTNEISTETFPDEFQILFAEECIFGAIRAKRGHEAAVRERGADELDRLWDSVINNYSPASPTTDSTTSKAAIDRYVTAMTLRLKGRVLVPSHQIDDHIKIAWTYIWNWAKWPFRRREGTFTIETDGTLTATGEIATFGFDQLATRYFHYNDTSREVAEWVEPDTLSRLRATYSGETGRPRWFRIEDSWVSGSGHLKSIIFIPTPDQQYTVNASVMVKAPTLESSRTATDVFTALPGEFHPILWDLVAGRVLMQFDRGDKGGDMGSSYRRNAEKMLENFGEEFSDQGRLGIDVFQSDTMRLLDGLPTIQSLNWE